MKPMLFHSSHLVFLHRAIPTFATFFLGATLSLSAPARNTNNELAATGHLSPSSQFNLPGQSRTRTCVRLKNDKVPLRFADGAPTGWFVRGDDPSQQGGSHSACPTGTAEMDVHEVLTNAAGTKLYFHPGGGPSHYRDYVQNGQYGHIAADDLESPPPPAGDINGKPAPLGPVRYLITPARFPHDMWYKPNVSDEGGSGSTYYTYGNPGFDKTRGQGDWTYINWSWVQNGGPQYPKNKCAGGGMVRAIGKRGAVLDGCAVEPIIGFSYGKDNQPNGRVTAFYGRTFAGPGNAGSTIYGWLPLSYQKFGGLIVPCIRRAQVNRSVGLPNPSAARDAYERMAWNLFCPTIPDPATRDRLVAKFKNTSGRMARMEIVTELARLDAPETIRSMLALLQLEKDAVVREQVLVLVTFMESAPALIGEICAAVTANTSRAEISENVRALDVLSNIPAPEVVQFVTSAWSRAGAEPSERAAAAEAITKLSSTTTIDRQLLGQAKAYLRVK